MGCGLWASGAEPGRLLLACGQVGLQEFINILGKHLEAVPQGSMGTFPVLMLGDPTLEWATGRAGTGMPEASRGSER